MTLSLLFAVYLFGIRCVLNISYFRCLFDLKAHNFEINMNTYIYIYTYIYIFVYICAILLTA